jgi:hypothetical protein
VRSEEEFRERQPSRVFKTYEGLCSKSFSNLFNAYTKTINQAYERSGSLFQERFKRKEVKSEAYFIRLVHYIHFNPQKHGLIQDFRDWPHSSYESFLSVKPTQLSRDEVLQWFGSKEAYKDFHRQIPTGLSDEEFG